MRESSESRMRARTLTQFGQDGSVAAILDIADD
jgi:hypothetical protein